jgi:hypothetical protein
MTTEERLEKVERELAQAKRRARRLVIAALACIGVLVVAWAGVLQATAQREAHVAPKVVARSFVLVDENGKTRAVLAGVKDGPALGLYDENGKTRAWLDVGEDGPGLTLYDENGKGRAMLAVGKDGPGLLGLYDENGKPSAVLDVGKHGPGLVLFDKERKIVFRAP